MRTSVIMCTVGGNGYNESVAEFVVVVNGYDMKNLFVFLSILLMGIGNPVLSLFF